MNRLRRLILGSAVLCVPAAWAQAPAGRFDATVTIGSMKVPFTMNFEGSGADLAGTLVFGDVRIRSTAGSFDAGKVRLEFPNASRLEASIGDSGFKGAFGNAQSGMHPFQATAFCTCGFLGEAGPDVMGKWEIAGTGYRVVIRRIADDTVATVTRGDNELGPLSGRFNGAFFELSYYDGTRAAVLEMEPRKDGGLDLAFMEPGKAPAKWKAVRATPAESR